MRAFFEAAKLFKCERCGQIALALPSRVQRVKAVERCLASLVSSSVNVGA